jgi:hypothetical protein
LGESSDSLFPSKREFKKNLRRHFGIPTNQRETRATGRYLKKYGWRIGGRWLLILCAYPFLWLYAVLKEWLYEVPKFVFYDFPRKLWRFFFKGG